MLILMTALMTLCESDSDGNFDQLAHKVKRVLCVALMLIKAMSITIMLIEHNSEDNFYQQDHEEHDRYCV